MRNGYSVEVFRTPPGETTPPTWDVLNDGLGYEEAMYQLQYLNSTFKDHKIRVMNNYTTSRCVANNHEL